MAKKYELTEDREFDNIDQNGRIAYADKILLKKGTIFLEDEDCGVKIIASDTDESIWLDPEMADNCPWLRPIEEPWATDEDMKAAFEAGMLRGMEYKEKKIGDQMSNLNNVEWLSNYKKEKGIED